MTAPITGLATAVYRVPTDQPEADGTLQWDATTAVVVTLTAGDSSGTGWTYSTGAAAALIHEHLVDAVCGRDVHDVAGGWSAMRRACRNLGARGLPMQAISAVDTAWWDLRARVLGVPLDALFGRARRVVPVYGSGGFTTLTDDQLAEQVAWWRDAGCSAMKIKIGESGGTRIDRDLARVRRLRELAGSEVALMVDANGGYGTGAARRVGAALDELGVVWFEEPVTSDDEAGLAVVRAAVRCDVAAGEYVPDAYDAKRLAPAVDCLQLDVTRCGGYTGWRQCAAVAAAHGLDVSGHCAPGLHAAVAASVPNVRDVEWFVDHARLEPLLFDGVPAVEHGALVLPDRPGHGMTVSERAGEWRVDDGAA